MTESVLDILGRIARATCCCREELLPIVFIESVEWDSLVTMEIWVQRSVSSQSGMCFVNELRR